MISRLKMWWLDACQPWRDRLQNILEDWTGNAIFAALLCIAGYINSLL